jgi:hypothetical protein
MIDLSRETFDKATELAPGFWIIATRHRPGFSRFQPEINNRCLVFRLNDTSTGKLVLLVVNGVDPKVMPEVRRLERETGLEVRYILSPGGGHHLQLPAWRDEFKSATVLVPPVRIPTTPSAKPLMDGPRVRTMSADDPLPQFKGQLDVVVFDGLLGFPDMKTTFEGGKEGFFTFFKMMKEMMSLHTPVDEVWVRHVATGTVIGGENLGWILSRKTLATFPFMLRKMMKPDTVYVQAQARKVADPARVSRAWRQVLAWRTSALMGYHEPPGEAFFGDGKAALEAAVAAVRQLS